ncbi:MAG TPA: response regulator [Azospirillum sp.]|nr:response regulator [Azospirillum sp.]
MKLLIVEGDPLIGPAMKAVLRGAGHTVFGPVRNAAKAMHLAEGERLDLALVDCHLVGTEDGLCVVRRLAVEHGVPSLLITGLDHGADEVRGEALGFLHKPFSPGALIGSVEAAGMLLAGNTPAAIPPALELFRLEP